MHLVILLLPHLEEESKVLLHEMVGEMLWMIFLLLSSCVVIPCGDIFGCSCFVLQLPTWRNLLLYLAASIAIVGVARLDDGRGQEVGFQSGARTQGWRLRFYLDRSVKRWRR